MFCFWQIYYITPSRVVLKLRHHCSKFGDFCFLKFIYISYHWEVHNYSEDKLVVVNKYCSGFSVIPKLNISTSRVEAVALQ